MSQYRLQTLLELRERAREDAEEAFARAVQVLAREKQLLAEREAELQRRNHEREQKVSAYLREALCSGLDAGGLAQMRRFEERLEQEEARLALEIEGQKEAVKEAAQLVEGKRSEMARAAVELEAIEKHREGWKKQVLADRTRREELAQDEIASALHSKTTRE